MGSWSGLGSRLAYVAWSTHSTTSTTLIIQDSATTIDGGKLRLLDITCSLQVRVVRSNSRCVGCVGCLLTPRGASEIARVFVCVQQMCRRQRTLERGKAPEQELGVECVLLVLFYSSTLLPLITSTCNPTAIPLVDGLKN